MRIPKGPGIEPLLSFIADPAGKLVKSQVGDPEEAQEELNEMETELIMTNAGPKMTR